MFGRWTRHTTASIGCLVWLHGVFLALTPARADDVTESLQRIEDYLEIEAAEHAFNRAVERDRLAAQTRSEPSWRPAPGAKLFLVCGGAGQAACQPPGSSQTPAVQPAVMAALDAAPDLAGRWRQINDDPAFLIWLDHADVFSGQKRLALLLDAYAQGDVERTAAFFRAFMAERSLPAANLTYRYIPTEQDRREITACVNSAGPNTMAIDCLMPTTNRIISAAQVEAGSPVWPAHPSQVTVMIHSAGLICGLPADRPQAPVPPSAKPCLNGETRKVATAVVTGLHDFQTSLGR